MDDWREKLLMASLIGTIWVILTLLGLGHFLGGIISIISSLILTNIYSWHRESKERERWVREQQEEEQRKEAELKARQKFYEEDSTLYNECRDRAEKEIHSKIYRNISPADYFKVKQRDQEFLTDQYYREAMEKKRREELERQRRETERLRILNEKTQQVQKENEYIGQDYVRWNELNTQSSVTAQTMLPCKKILALLNNIADDHSTLLEIKKQLRPFEQIALEKMMIVARVEKVVALYNDIDNPQEACKLKEKFGL